MSTLASALPRQKMETKWKHRRIDRVGDHRKVLI
jgi:hypothetical protein